MPSVGFDTIERDISIPADKKTLIAAFNLSPMEAGFLQVLLDRDWVGKDEFPSVNYSIRQVIYTLRKKIEHGSVRVINDGQGRYSIPISGKRALSLAIQKVTQGE